VQFGVDEGEEILRGGGVAVVHSFQELGHVSRGGFHGVPRDVCMVLWKPSFGPDR
jgi:hypothetical protein